MIDLTAPRHRASGVPRRPAGIAALQRNSPPALGIVLASVVVGVAAGRSPVMALGLVLAIGGVLVVLLRPGFAVYLLPMVPVLSGLGRGFPVPGLRVSEILSLWIGVTLIVRGSMGAGSRAPRWRAFDWISLAYIGALVLVPLYDVYVGGQPAGPSPLQVFGPVQYIVLFRAAVLCLDTRARQLTALRIVLVSSTITNVFAVLQAASVPGVRPFINTLIGLDPYATSGYVAVPRATGLFPHWHVLAGYDTAIVLVIVALWLGKRSVLPRALAAVVVGLAIAGIAVSVTTTTTIGVILGAVVIGLLTGTLRRILFWIVVTGSAVGALIWPLISARFQAQTSAPTDGSVLPQTIVFRTQVWTEQYIPAIFHRPLTGYGPQLPVSISWPYPENVYLSLLVVGGVLLLAVYLAWTAALLTLTLRISTSTRATAADGVAVGVARALFALTVALVIMQLLFPYMLTAGLPALIWLLAAIVVRNRHLMDSAADHRFARIDNVTEDRESAPTQASTPAAVSTAPTARRNGESP